MKTMASNINGVAEMKLLIQISKKKRNISEENEEENENNEESYLAWKAGKSMTGNLLKSNESQK